MRKDFSDLRIDKEKKYAGGSSGAGLWILIALVGWLLAFGAGYYLLFYESVSADPEAPAVDAAPPPLPNPAGRVDPEGERVLVASGYVVAHHKIELGSKVMGKVAWVGVEKGDQVRKGQLLVKLEDSEYRARVSEAEANVSYAQARLEELTAGYLREEIERAKAELTRAEADLENAKLELQRLEKLLSQGVIAPREVDNARARFDMARASVEAARKSHQLLEKGPRDEQIAQARAELERARASLRFTQTQLEATEIRAPISGTVLERIVEVGEMVTTSFAGEFGAKSAVVALADLQDLQVELDISQADFSRISPEHACSMSPEAYSDRRYPCRIAEIAPEANRQKATIQVKVQVLEPDSFLRPEMTAQVEFFKAANQDAQM